MPSTVAALAPDFVGLVRGLDEVSAKRNYSRVGPNLTAIVKATRRRRKGKVRTTGLLVVGWLSVK
jgi:hypothetical protein